MIFVIYLIGLICLLLYLRRVEKEYRGLYLVAYHFLLLLVIFIRFHLQQGDGGDPAHLFVLSLYEAVMAMTFQIEMAPFTAGEILIAFAGAICTFGTIVYAFFHQAFARILARWRMSTASRMIVLSGAKEDVRALTADIRAQAPDLKKVPVIYVPTGKEDPEEEQGIRGALTAGPDFLRRLKKRTRYDIVLLPDKNNDNIRRLKELNELDGFASDLRVTAFIENDLLRFEDLHFDRLDAYYVSRESLVVRRFMKAHPPIEQLVKNVPCQTREQILLPARPFRLCVVGYDTLTEEFLLHTYENTACETEEGGWGMEALIIDLPGESDKRNAATEDLYQDVPYFLEESAIRWKRTGTEAPEFFDCFEDGEREFDQILIGTMHTEENMRIAMRLLRLYKRRARKLPQIIVVFHDDAPGSVALLEGQENVFFLQANHTQFSYDELIGRSVDVLAKRLHEGYRATAQDVKNWNALGTFLQESNRASALDVPNKRALAPDLINASPEAQDEALWALARYEHRRWNAFHYTRGWTRLPVEALTEEEKRTFVTKHRAEKRHICLTSWDALDALPQEREGLIKYYDYRNVREQLIPGEAQGAEKSV